jgi:HAE1 family hydrophobic/amphiphilic exporter-1
MWFTRVSIGNPVMAVMVMLAFVVLGVFGVQRLKVDQFPNIEFPTVVVSTEYPGASPEIVEIEVTRRVEEAVNTIGGISQLFSRSYEGVSVVIVQFNLDVDGRKAADDVREKVALVRPVFRPEVKESRVQRFDPTSRPVFTLALTFHGGMQAICVHEVHIAQLTHEVLARVLARSTLVPEGQVDDGLRAHLRDDEEREGLFLLLHALHQIDQVGALLLFCRAHLFEHLARVRVGLVVAGAHLHFVMHPVLSGFVT